MGEPAGKAQAPSPEPHRANPAFGTIVILKGNLASRQVPFFSWKRTEWLKSGLQGKILVAWLRRRSVFDKIRLEE